MSEPDAGANGEKSESELEAYLMEVSQQLEKREAKLMRIHSDISVLEGKLQDLRSEKSLRLGSAARISSVEAFKESLRRKLVREYREREEALGEVSRARERKSMILVELNRIRAKS